MALRADVAAVRAAPRLQAVDVTTVRRDLLDLADAWRSVLGHDPTNARPIVTALLIGRVTMTPTTERKVWKLRGKGTLSGLFTREICRKVVRPHRDSRSFAVSSRGVRSNGRRAARGEKSALRYAKVKGSSSPETKMLLQF